MAKNKDVKKQLKLLDKVAREFFDKVEEESNIEEESRTEEESNIDLTEQNCRLIDEVINNTLSSGDTYLTSGSAKTMVKLAQLKLLIKAGDK